MPELQTNVLPKVRRANRLLLLAMVVFAFALTSVCLLWMYGRMKRQEALERAAVPPKTGRVVAPTISGSPKLAFL